MFPAGTIFPFNAVLRQPQIVDWNYLGGALLCVRS
jgi:hypothetical protein